MFRIALCSPLLALSLAAAPVIEEDLQRSAYFEGSTTSFGPIFSETTETTAYQWYRGESGDTRVPIAGATTERITATNLIPDEKVWMRASDVDGSTDSAAVAFAALKCSPLQLDIISRDPNRGTWNESINSHLAEDGSVAFFGSPAVSNNLNFIFSLPYQTRFPLLDFGVHILSSPLDISSNARYLIFDHPDLYDAVEDDWFPLYTSQSVTPSALSTKQISSDGRYLLMRTSRADLISGDTNGITDLFLHDRDDGTFTGITRFPDGSGNQTSGVTHEAEISGEEFVFFSHFFTDPLVPGETGNLYIYDIAKESLGVIPPVQGKGAHARFLDASSNGRFILLFWNAQTQALREEEPVDPENSRQILYVYDRENDLLSHVTLPFPTKFTREHTISNDGQTVCFIHWGGNLNEPYLARKIINEDLWAVKRLIPLPIPSGNTTELQMSDDGSRFLFGSRFWSLMTPQYATGSSNDQNSSNVMFIEGLQVTRLPTFESWSQQLSADLRNEQADPDGDGISNLMEFLAGTSPTRADGDLVKISAPSTVTYQERAGGDSGFIPQASASLEVNSWEDIPEENISRAEAIDGFHQITVTMPSAERQFFRLRLP